MSAAPSISIIVPVYNVAPYLPKCLDSLVNQTLCDIEIICVDDGSTDESPSILASYAQRDDRLIIIHQENAGLSAARNAGMREARGEYIAFVDSDDYVEPNTYELALKCMGNDVDYVCFGVQVEGDISTQDCEAVERYFDHAENGCIEVTESFLLKSDAAAWNKIYRRSIINERGLTFPEGLVYEDNYFYHLYGVWARHAFYMPEKCYHYVRRADSIMGQTLARKASTVGDMIEIIRRMHDYLQLHGQLEMHMHRLCRIFFNLSFQSLRCTPKSKRSLMWDEVRSLAVTLQPERFADLTMECDCLRRCVCPGVPRKIGGGVIRVRHSGDNLKYTFLGLPLWRIHYGQTERKSYLFSVLRVSGKQYENYAGDLLLKKVSWDIDRAEVVSFDIFDTLLLRPYAKPVDLFNHLEKLENKPGYAEARREAEISAVNKLGREVTLDDIYGEIAEEFKTLEEKEKELEKQTLCQNPELKQVYDYARSVGKKIVIASDMYLPTNFVAEVLRKNGYDGWDLLLVSGEAGKAKHTGEMYHHILQCMKLRSPKYLLHIGDNKHSDYKVPKKLGVHAVRYKSVWRRCVSSDARLMDYYMPRQGKIGASILTGIIAIHRQRERCQGRLIDSYWRRLGYEYAGPIACGYAEFVAARCKKQHLDSLLFVARDGYTLQKVCRILHPEIRSAYVYAPRFLSMACRGDIAEQTPQICRILLEHFKGINPELQRLLADAAPKTERDYQLFVKEHLNLLRKVSEGILAQYRKYLYDVLPSEQRLGVVDTITNKFSAQRLVEQALGCSVHGLYWGIVRNKFQCDVEYSTFAANEQGHVESGEVMILNWNLMEFLLTAPELPIRMLSASNKPVYVPDPHPEEIRRMRVYPEIEQGATDFSRDIINIFGNLNPFFDSQTLIDWVNSLLRTPSADDLKYLGSMQMAMDSAHTEYVPIFVENCTVAQALLHPKRVRKTLKNSFWRTPWQTLLLNILRPVAFVKPRRLRHPAIVLLPNLSKEYFVLALRLGKVLSIHIIVGKPLSVI